MQEINLKFDRELTISVAKSRKETFWANQLFTWSDILKKIQNPVKSTETLNEYMKLPKSQQDDLKDVGGLSVESF